MSVEQVKIPSYTESRFSYFRNCWTLEIVQKGNGKASWKKIRKIEIIRNSTMYLAFAQTRKHLERNKNIGISFKCKEIELLLNSGLVNTQIRLHRLIDSVSLLTRTRTEAFFTFLENNFVWLFPLWSFVSPQVLTLDDSPSPWGLGCRIPYLSRS